MPHLKPTKPGDVLILRTRQSFTIYAVGPVLKSGQEDFREQETVNYAKDQPEAVKAAKALVRPGGRIYLFDIDTADWSEISH